MKVAVLGGGHGSYATAAALSEAGHEVRLWRRDHGSFAPVLEGKRLTLIDHRGRRDVRIALPTRSLAEAVHGAKIIVIPLPATTHESLALELVPLLAPDQLIFLPPGTFGSVVFLRALRATCLSVDVTFAETGTLPYLARKRGPTEVAISAYATRLPAGFLPACNTGGALPLLQQLFPSVEGIEDALSGALMNAGPIIHPPLIMMNAGALEHFPKWDIHNEGTQPSIRRVTEVLDEERIAIRSALGYTAPHFPLRDHYSPDGDEWMYGRAAHQRLQDSGDWREQISLKEHRYMMEDTALGLSFLVSVGKWARVPTPIAAGLLALGSVITGRDHYANGRTLERLRLAHYSKDRMARLLREGAL